MPTTTYQLETNGACATLYLSGTLRRDQAMTLSAFCAALPSGVRTLRIDVHSVGLLAGEAMASLQTLVRAWRSSRGGDFRLCFSGPLLHATYTEGAPPPAEPWRPAPAETSAAMLAAVL